MYNKIIMENFLNPNYAGLLSKADLTAKVQDKDSGEILKIYIKYDDNVITEAKFKAFGSPVIIACANILCGMIIGEEIESLLQISHANMLEKTGEIPVEKIKTLTLLEEGLKELVNQYNEIKEK